MPGVFGETDGEEVFGIHQACFEQFPEGFVGELMGGGELSIMILSPCHQQQVNNAGASGGGYNLPLKRFSAEKMQKVKNRTGPKDDDQSQGHQKFLAGESLVAGLSVHGIQGYPLGVGTVKVGG